MNQFELARFKGNQFAETLLRFPCPQNVLMVTDGLLNFGNAGFGLSEFVGLVQSAGHSVATAHRSSHASASISGSFNFDTAATAVTLANYDQLWLFGFSTSALSAGEQAQIATFMQGGGGVFATGDHESIGAGMGAHLPRVNAMRNWSSVPMTAPERHDTVLDPGADGIKQFDDQADAVAQRIYPVFFSNGGPADVATSWNPHPVLRHPSGAVDYLPDHPHESECLAPRVGPGNFAGVEQWPAPIGGGDRIRPQLAAVSISAGRFITDAMKPPVRPHSFGAISVYDGDAARVGRIVCDATWHHFVNINLNGSGATPDPSATPRNGLYVAGVATPEYEKIKRYYLNTVRWLAPRNRRNCWPFLVSSLARFDFEMLEMRLPEPHPCPWDLLQKIGQVSERVLARHWGPGAAVEVVDDLLAASNALPALARLLKEPSEEPSEGQEGKEPSLLPLAELRRAVLASTINTIARHLPADEEKLADLLGEGHDAIAGKLIQEGLRAAELSIGVYLERALKHTSGLVKAIQVAR